MNKTKFFQPTVESYLSKKRKGKIPTFEKREAFVDSMRNNVWELVGEFAMLTLDEMKGDGAYIPEGWENVCDSAYRLGGEICEGALKRNVFERYCVNCDWKNCGHGGLN